MRIGIVGLGKLGLPVALAIESKGHSVVGYDISKEVTDNILKRKLTYQEEGAQELLDKTQIQIGGLDYIVGCDIVFVAVQTPHDPLYEGVTRLPDKRVDFDYSYLVTACTDLKAEIDKQGVNPLVVVISTCLPGTIESKILPILDVVYNPFFIAMGTVIHDFLNPEFVLMGSNEEWKDCSTNEVRKWILVKFYDSIHGIGEKQYWCSIREAEMIKVSYNTFITSKIAIANTIGEMCHKLHINSDVVMDALKMGTDRIISTNYLNAGMGDGGGCHPRDNIALSWLAQNVNLSFDWYENLMIQREKHCEFLADLIIEQHFKHPELPIIILGRAFKPNTNIETGSPAILLGNILKERGIEFKHFELPIGKNDYDKCIRWSENAIYFIATNHEYYKNIRFTTSESIVLDPFGIIEEGNFELIKIGR